MVRKIAVNLPRSERAGETPAATPIEPKNLKSRMITGAAIPADTAIQHTEGGGCPGPGSACACLDGSKGNDFSAELRCEKNPEVAAGVSPAPWGRMKEIRPHLYRRKLPHLRMEGAIVFCHLASA